jgi:hypothetical protein
MSSPRSLLRRATRPKQSRPPPNERRPPRASHKGGRPIRPWCLGRTRPPSRPRRLQLSARPVRRWCSAQGRRPPLRPGPLPRQRLERSPGQLHLVHARPIRRWFLGRRQASSLRRPQRLARVPALRAKRSRSALRARHQGPSRTRRWSLGLPLVSRPPPKSRRLVPRHPRTRPSCLGPNQSLHLHLIRRWPSGRPQVSSSQQVAPRLRLLWPIRRSCSGLHPNRSPLRVER